MLDEKILFQYECDKVVELKNKLDDYISKQKHLEEAKRIVKRLIKTHGREEAARIVEVLGDFKKDARLTCVFVDEQDD